MGEDGTTYITGKDGHGYAIPKRKNIDDGFEFETEDLDQILRGAHPGNCGITEDMKKFTGYEKFITMKNGT